MKEYFIKSKFGKINIIQGKTSYNPLGIILHIHGLGSHFQHIYNTPNEFNYRDDIFYSNGYISYGFEFHGHGKSEGIKCLINNFDDLLEDLKNVLIFLEKKHPYLPIYLLAESMGGAVALKYCIINNNCDNIKGVILLSPLYKIHKHLLPNKFIVILLYVFSYLFPRLTIKSHEKPLLNSLKSEEYIIAKKKNYYSWNTSHRLATIREMYKINLWLPNNIHKFKKPLLILHGDNDVITCHNGSSDIINKINDNKKELIIIPKGEHLLLTIKEFSNELYKYIISFIKS